MRLEHIGVAVDAPDAAARTFRALLKATPYKTETVPDQGVRTHFLDAGAAKLELLEALGEDSPVRSFLEQRGEGVHHIAFSVPSLTATVEQLRAAGFELLSETPQNGADDKQIVFVHPKQTHGVLVEFCAPRTPDWSPRRIARPHGSVSAFVRGPEDAPPLVVLHGAVGSTRHETAPLIQRLESSFRVIGVDLSGHGDSALPDAPLTLDLFAADVCAVLDALDVPDAHVVGFSLGGGVALHLAATRPERVRRLAVLQTTVSWTEAQAAQMKQRLALDALEERAPARADRIRRRHTAPTPLLRRVRAFVDTLPAAAQALADGRLAVTAPTLVVAVDRDPLFPLDDALSLHRRLRTARLTVLPGTRHAFHALPLDALLPPLHTHLTASARIAS